MYPIFVFAKCCWSNYSKVIRLGKNAHSNQRKDSHTKSAVSSLCACPASSASIYSSVFFLYMVWHGPTSETASVHRRQKNWLKYTDFTELKTITGRIHSNCSNYSYLFFKSFKFRCCSFCFIKKICSYLYKCAAYLLFTSLYIFRRKS